MTRSQNCCVFPSFPTDRDRENRFHYNIKIYLSDRANTIEVTSVAFKHPTMRKLASGFSLLDWQRYTIMWLPTHTGPGLLIPSLANAARRDPARIASSARRTVGIRIAAGMRQSVGHPERLATSR